MKRVTALSACAGAVVFIGLSLTIGYHAGQRSALRRMRTAIEARAAGAAWVTQDIVDHPGALIDWLTICVCAGTNGPYWTLRGSRPLDRKELESILARINPVGCGGMFVYGETNATVEQVEQTLDILKAHSFSNVLMFARVQGVLDPPFEWPEELVAIESDRPPADVRSAGRLIVGPSEIGEPGVYTNAEWRVSEADLLAAEQAMAALFAAPDARMAGLIGDLPKRAPFPLSDYYMRYAGVVQDGRRLVIGKGFHRSGSDAESVLLHPDSGVVVFGGGAGYFTLVYDADGRRLLTLSFDCAL